MRIKFVLTTYLFCMGSLYFANGQVIEPIAGSGDVTQVHPITKFSAYSLSEMIYLKSEINTAGINFAGNITTLAFHKAAGTNLTDIPNVTIYMRHTTATSYAAEGNFYVTDTKTLVYSGTFPNNAETGWMEVSLTTPFAYNNVDNLEILVVNESNSSIADGLERPRWTTNALLGVRTQRAIRNNPLTVCVPPCTPPPCSDMDACANICPTKFLDCTAAFGSGISGNTPIVRLNFENPLPITLLFFKAEEKDKKVLLSWATATETNNDFFTVERSKDARNWQETGNLKAVGNSSQRQDYSLRDENPLPGLAYYRLKQTDFDKSFSYSPVVSLFREEDLEISLYPNPATRKIYLKGLSGSNPTTRLEIWDNLGRRVKTIDINKSDPSEDFEMDISDLKAGMYFVKMWGGLQIKIFKIIKQ